MAEFKNACGSGGFKEAVCIDVGRVYDSCCDRDCTGYRTTYYSHNYANCSIGYEVKQRKKRTKLS